MQYWLMKSEPTSYGIDHLKSDGTTAWTGVRNYQARNFMREMKIGDKVLFYHSNCKEPGIYGLAKVVSLPYPDPTQFDEKSHYYEKRATKDMPVWDLVDISFVQKFTKPALLPELRTHDFLYSMLMLRPGSRLSVTPTTETEYEEVLRLATRK